MHMYGGGINAKLTRDCKVIQIPDGNTMILEQGHEVYITQVLGGMFTVETESFALVRIDGQDADALGQEIPKERQKPDWGKFASLEDAAWSQLKTCYDPEIPVNIVELGLIYKLDMSDQDLRLLMTLTAPGCGMGQVLKTDIEAKLSEIPGIESVTIDLVFDPAWSSEMMSYAARLQLGIV